MVKIDDHQITRHYEGMAVDFHISTHKKKSGYISWTDNSDHREGEFKKHWDDNVIKPMKEESKNNVYTNCMDQWKSGKTASQDQLKQMVETAQKLSPDELQEAVKAGLISDEEAEALTVIGGIMASGMDADGKSNTSLDDVQDAMKNFYALGEDDQQWVVKLMSSRDVAHSVMENLHSGRKDDNYDFTDQPSELTGYQMRAAIFLTDAKDSQLGNMRQFVSFHYEDDDYDNVSTFKDLKNWGVLGDDQRRNLGKMVKALPDKTAEDAALEGYGTQYNIFGNDSDRDKALADVQAMKGKVDSSLTDLESKLDAGEDVQVLSSDDMNAYLEKNVSGFKDFKPDVKAAMVDYALQQVAGHLAATMSGDDGKLTADSIAAYCAANIDGWDSMSEDDQNKIVNNILNEADLDTGTDGNGNYVKNTYNADGTKTTSVVGEVLTPEDLRGTGLDENGTMDVGTLMFLVLMDRENSQQELIRGYADDVDAKNQDVKNATKVLSKLRAQDTGDTVDIEDLTFTSQSGKETSVYDFCQAYGVDIPQDSDGDPKTDLDKTGVQSLIDSIKSSSDTMTTDAQSALQKLQQAIDRMTNTNSLVSNFESTWTSMQKGNINNMNIR